MLGRHLGRGILRLKCVDLFGDRLRLGPRLAGEKVIDAQIHQTRDTEQYQKLEMPFKVFDFL